MQEFEVTVEDYAEARQYLIENGKGWLIDDMFMTDGWTIIYLANQLIRELND